MAETTWWEVTGESQYFSIRSRTIVRETEKCLWLKATHGEPRRVLKRNKWHLWFPTREQAIAWRRSRLVSEISAVEGRLERARAYLVDFDLKEALDGND